MYLIPLFLYLVYPSLFRAEEYTFWQCGIGSVSKVDSPSCTCGISRVVSQPANSNTAVPIFPGEYLSEAACNAQCKRGPEDKCWVCVEQYSGFPGGGATYFCQVSLMI